MFLIKKCGTNAVTYCTCGWQPQMSTLACPSCSQYLVMFCWCRFVCMYVMWKLLTSFTQENHCWHLPEVHLSSYMRSSGEVQSHVSRNSMRVGRWFAFGLKKSCLQIRVNCHVVWWHWSLLSLGSMLLYYVLSDVGMNICDAVVDNSPTSPSEGRHETGSVQSSDSEFYWQTASSMM